MLLVVIDTLRADKLGSYGDERGLTPNLDRLADEGILFEQVSAHAPWTLPSMASLLTSLYPRQHGAGGHVPGFTRLAPGAETAASIFAEEGYATAAVVNVTFLGPHFGLDRGFAHLDEKSFENNVDVRDATETTDAALAWLEENGERPFFLLAHYFDPHAVYAPPQPFRRRFAQPVDREDESFVFGTREHMIALRAGRLDLDKAVLLRAEALYDGEVAYADHEVGRLLEGLEAMGLADRVCVVVTSDHGEEFLDHGGFEHGHTLYGELTNVPLILRLPGKMRPRRIASAVRHVDVLPTLCALCGVPPRSAFAGRSLVPLLRGQETDHRPALAHGNFWGPPLTSWREGTRKLIARPPVRPGETPRSELYDWLADPRETTDLAAGESEVVRTMLDRLRGWEQNLQARMLEGSEKVELSEDHLELLRSLGYAGEDLPDDAGD